MFVTTAHQSENHGPIFWPCAHTLYKFVFVRAKLMEHLFSFSLQVTKLHLCLILHTITYRLKSVVVIRIDTSEIHSD